MSDNSMKSALSGKLNLGSWLMLLLKLESSIQKLPISLKKDANILCENGPHVF